MEYVEKYTVYAIICLIDTVSMSYLGEELGELYGE